MDRRDDQRQDQRGDVNRLHVGRYFKNPEKTRFVTAETSQQKRNRQRSAKGSEAGVGNADQERDDKQEDQIIQHQPVHGDAVELVINEFESFNTNLAKPVV